MRFRFDAELWYWRGPAPHVFATLPADASALVAARAGELSYGWGMIPVAALIGDTEWTTAMFAKDGGYVVPVKVAVRRAEQVDEGDTVAMTVSVIEPED